MPAQTKRQREVLEIIARFLDTHGYGPSYQSIAKDLGLRSRAGIARIVKELESQGLLERRRDNGHFSIEMKIGGSSQSIDWLDIPPNISEPEDAQTPMLTLPAFIIGRYEPTELRAFRVTDSAMAPEIEEGDIALIEIRDFCRNDTTIVARLDDGRHVLRKYFRVNSEVELRSAADKTESLILAANRVEIIGICRGLIRPAV